MAVQHAVIGFDDCFLCWSKARIGFDNYLYFAIPVFVFSNDIFGLAEQLGLTTQPTEHKVAILTVFLAIGAYVPTHTGIDQGMWRDEPAFWSRIVQ
ncbi:hypothetical protein D3C86_1666520 [compost metagenome]